MLRITLTIDRDNDGGKLLRAMTADIIRTALAILPAMLAGKPTPAPPAK